MKQELHRQGTYARPLPKRINSLDGSFPWMRVDHAKQENSYVKDTKYLTFDVQTVSQQVAPIW